MFESGLFSRDSLAMEHLFELRRRDVADGLEMPAIVAELKHKTCCQAKVLGDIENVDPVVSNAVDPMLVLAQPART